MRKVNFLCLASSYKPGGRCVAGIDLNNGEWIRPVSSGSSGTVPHDVYMLSNANRAVRPLDQVVLGLDAAQPEPEQPENWVIGDRPWTLADTWTLDEAADVLDDLTSADPKLFGSSGRSLSEDEIPTAGVPASLTIVRADTPTFYLHRRPTGSKQLRATFRLGEEYYDLPVSDMEPWADRLREEDHRREAPGLWRFTCSLALRWNGVCYKLIAAGFEP